MVQTRAATIFKAVFLFLLNTLQGSTDSYFYSALWSLPIVQISCHWPQNCSIDTIWCGFYTQITTCHWRNISSHTDVLLHSRPSSSAWSSHHLLHYDVFKSMIWRSNGVRWGSGKDGSCWKREVGEEEKQPGEKDISRQVMCTWETDITGSNMCEDWKFYSQGHCPWWREEGIALMQTVRMMGTLITASVVAKYLLTILNVYVGCDSCWRRHHYYCEGFDYLPAESLLSYLQQLNAIFTKKHCKSHLYTINCIYRVIVPLDTFR